MDDLPTPRPTIRVVRLASPTATATQTTIAGSSTSSAVADPMVDHSPPQSPPSLPPPPQPIIPPDTGTPTVTFRVRNNSQESDDIYMYAGTPDVQSTAVPNTPKISDEIKEAFHSLNRALDTDSTVLHVLRGDIDGIIDKYREPLLVGASVVIDFIGERGADLGGLTKYFFTDTWIKNLELYFKGEAAVVPFLPLHLQRAKKKDFIAIGRILAHSMAILQTLPPRLSCSLLLTIAFGEEQVPDDVLLKYFFLFLTPGEKDVVSKGIRNVDILQSHERKVIEMLFSMFCFLELPIKEKFAEQVLSIARSELIDKPGPLVELMKKGIPSFHLEQFWSVLTVDAITELYKAQRPSPSAVKAVIVPEMDTTMLTPQQDVALYFLQKFVGELDQDSLENFLRFTTASLVMPERIRVAFTGLIGIQRRPMAHTCTNQIDIPHTYETYQEFRREFRAVLANPESYKVDIL